MGSLETLVKGIGIASLFGARQISLGLPQGKMNLG